MESSKLPTLTQRQPDRFAKQLRAGSIPNLVDWWRDGMPARISFSDGSVSFGSCIRCVHPPCLEYSSAELELKIFSEFPADRNDQVCPTGAITWPLDTDSPVVSEATCILCGLCVNRCPVRAIYLDDNSAHVNDAPNRNFVISGNLSTEATTSATAAIFDNINERGCYRAESDKGLYAFLNQVVKMASNQDAQFPNHLARNLLLACGVGSAMRRRGDTNVRMDMVLGPPGVDCGTAEIEIGEGVLDSPRNILDNVAVLVARYGLQSSSVLPLIVSLQLPNQRSEYWQVIKDIRTVLGVRINSLTLGALVVLVWNRKSIVIRSGEEFYIDSDSPSLRSALERSLGRKLQVITGHPGFVESAK